MVDDITLGLLKSDVGRAADNLRRLILNADSADKIALARAVYLYKDTRYILPPARQALVGLKASKATLQSLQKDAVTNAKETVSWDKATPENGKAHAIRRKQYQDYIDLVTKQFEQFHTTYQKLAPSVSIPPYPKSSLTSDYLSVLRTQVLAWYDSKLSSKSIPEANPQDGIARFITEHRESLILLKATHTVTKASINRKIASKACNIQLLLAPVLSLAIGLYKPWDGPKTFSFKTLTDFDRAVLALGMFIPSFGRLFKSGRPVYDPDRLSLIYGGNPSLWDLALRYCTVISDHRDSQHLLDSFYASIGPSKLVGPTGFDSAALLTIVSAPSSFQESPPEWWLVDLWTDLKSRHPWLATAQLDEWAIRRVLLVGPNLSHIQSQLLAELAETRIATFLQNKAAVYALGIADAPDGCTFEFVPGHAFRAGDKIPEFVNRQISDGVIGYWDNVGFHVVAVLEAKVDSVGVRELGHAKTTGLSPEEQLQLRRFAKRELAEDREVADRLETPFKAPIDRYERQILQFETGSQVSRDVNRLEILDQVRINGVLGRLLRSPPEDSSSIKVFAVVPKNTEPTDLEKEVLALNSKRQSSSSSSLQFEVLAVPPTADQLKAAANTIFLKAKDLFPTSTAWPNLDSEQVLPRIQKLLQDPFLFQQGVIGLCTAVTFLYHIFELKPIETVKFAQDLYIHGHSTLGKMDVRPLKDLLNADYQSIFLIKGMREAPPQADWMIMCSVCSSETWWTHIAGPPSDYNPDVDASTSEMAGWYTNTGFFTTVEYVSYWITDPSVETMQALVKTDNNAIALWIKPKLLRSLYPWVLTTPILDTDTHMIAMTSTPVIDKAMNKIEFMLWTWGENPKLLKEELDFVRDCILGTIVATI